MGIFSNVITDLKWLVSIGQRARQADVAELHQAIRLLEDCPAIADALDAAERSGAETDEPEGNRWVKMSDTLAKQLAARLRGVQPDGIAGDHK